MSDKEIMIDNKIYTFLDNINYKGKSYIFYEDTESIYISEYRLNEDRELEIISIDDNNIIDELKEIMNI